MVMNGEKKGRGKTVVIVGAGAAGLQAANVLLESDAFLGGRLDVIILEARDRVGGRIHVDRKWGLPFDLGT
jgi:monoamine oxidase